MIGSQALYLNAECLLIERLGLLIPSLVPIEQRKVIKRFAGTWMIGANVLLLKSNIALEQVFGGCVLPLPPEELGLLLHAFNEQQRIGDLLLLGQDYNISK